MTIATANTLRPAQWVWPVLLFVLIVAIGFPVGWRLARALRPVPPVPHAIKDPSLQRALRMRLAGQGVDPALVAFYRSRDFEPLWIDRGRIDPAGWTLVSTLERARDDGLDPAAYRPMQLRRELASAMHGDSAKRAAVDSDLSATFARYVMDLRRGRTPTGFVYADASIAPRPLNAFLVLDQAARAPSLSAYLAASDRLNPLYDQLRSAWLAQRTRAPQADQDRLDRIVAANLDRLRVLPADLGARYIVVNAAAANMTLYAAGQPVLSMEAVVGKPSEPTPQFAGVLRYVVLKPYWNVPIDLDREMAEKVLASGADYLSAHHFQVLSDWTDQAQPIDPATLDWSAVAAGTLKPRIRQLPAADNMLGQVKFMFPNAFGVYMHDTPYKQLFAANQRTFSAGCVRLRRAADLEHALVGDVIPGSAPEERVPLAHPLPVYLIYQTVTPGSDGLVRRPDVYHRDPA